MMYSPLNAELMLLQADELRRDMRAARNNPGPARRRWRRQQAAASRGRAARRTR